MPSLPSTDPSDIANAARCFSSCITGVNDLAVKTYLLTQLANIATPPCITPISVPLVTPKTVGPNSIFITWSQLANTGSLITSYTVFWGTSSGVYTNSATVPVIPRNYTISGLTSGTQYFFVVQANSSAAVGCSSALSVERSATTTGSSACAAGATFATNWANRVVANGGIAPSAATQLAVANFQCGLITDGLDTLMISWNALVSDSLTAAITPQLVGGGNDPWTNHNFVGADLTVNGLLGDGATKWLNTGVQPSLIWGGATTEGGLTAYMYVNTGAVITNCMIGCGDGIGYVELQTFGGSSFWDIFNNIAGQGRISAADGTFQGYISGNRTAANAFAVYEANSVTPHNTLVSGITNGGRVPINPFAFSAFVSNDNTGTFNFSNQRLSFLAIHHGLTSAQSSLFAARIQTLRTALGGGFR